jgi:hypothetical protein
MSKCKFCEQEMTAPETVDCTANRSVRFLRGKRRSLAVPHSGPARCHDCNVAAGGYHHPGCDAEECPRCGGQIISCACGAL